MSQSKSRNRRRGASVLAAATLAAVVATTVATPAYALDGPVANSDYKTDTSRTASPITQNVLANDTWDKGTVATLTDVRLQSAQRSQFPRARVADDSIDLNPEVTFTPGGDVTVNFGPYDFASAPSVRREAHVIYTFTDSAGQTAEGAAHFYEEHTTTPMTLRDDSNATLSVGQYAIEPTGPIVVNNSGDPVELRPVYNDALGNWDDYAIEVVTQPETGTVTVPPYGGATDLWFYGPENAYDERTDTFQYRLCTSRLRQNNVCSAPATVALTTVKPKANAEPVYDLNHAAWFWDEGPTSYRFDPATTVANHPKLQGRTGLTYTHVDTAYDHGNVTDNTDGTFTYAATDFPATRNDGSAVREQPVMFNVTDSDGTLVAVVRLDLAFRQPFADGNPAANLGDEEVWVRVGQRTNFLPFENDAFEHTANSQYLPIGAEGVNPWQNARTVKNTTLGTLDRETVELNPQGMAHQFQNSYTAGNVAGTDTWDYQVCAYYPRAVGCDIGTVTFHVSPDVAATDDKMTGVPAVPVDVQVLGNDTYTDNPTRNAAVTILDVPAGVTATLDNRVVTVTAGPEFAGQTVDVDYRLDDFTGTSEATISVVYPGVDVLVDPIAVDDTATVVEGDAVTIPVLDNDTYEGTPLVNARLVADGGYTVTQTAGELVVDTEPGFEGDEIVLGYALTDDNGSDQATVTVMVTRPVVVPPVVPEVPEVPEVPTPEVPVVPEVPDVPTPEVPVVPEVPDEDIPVDETPDDETPDVPTPDVPKDPTPEIPTINAGAAHAVTATGTAAAAYGESRSLVYVWVMLLLVGAGGLLFRRKMTSNA